MPKRPAAKKPDALDRLLDVTDHYCDLLGTSMPRMTAKYRKAEIRRLVHALLHERADAADAAWLEVAGRYNFTLRVGYAERPFVRDAVRAAVLSRPRKGVGR